MKRPIRKRLQFVARLHFWVMFFAFVGYLGMGFTLGPSFLFQDVHDKFFVLADDIVVTATVPGPPATPVVTATPVCVSGAPRINLDWANDSGTTTWDIDRDSLPLTTGVVVSNYTDTAVTGDVTYSYVVTAYGPMSPGVAVSNAVLATAIDCASITPVTVRIETLGDTNVSTDRTGVTLSRRRPRISGTASIPGAIITIYLTNPTMQAIVTANANGYFSWIPSGELKNGNHILSVTAADPNDTSRTATDSFIFRTKNDHEDDDEESPATTAIPAPPVGFDFSVMVENAEGSVFQGDELVVSVTKKDAPFPVGTIFRSVLIDARGTIQHRLPEVAVSELPKTSYSFVAKLPLSLSAGEYRVRVDAILPDGASMSREAFFQVRAWPLIEFGGGRAITYPQVVSFLGWIFFSLFFLFLFFLLLFIREYWLYLHSVRHITERELARFGFIPKRKGVRV